VGSEGTLLAALLYGMGFLKAEYTHGDVFGIKILILMRRFLHNSPGGVA
jgi:hypothetical protein